MVLHCWLVGHPSLAQLSSLHGNGRAPLFVVYAPVRKTAWRLLRANRETRARVWSRVCLSCPVCVVYVCACVRGGSCSPPLLLRSHAYTGGVPSALIPREISWWSFDATFIGTSSRPGYQGPRAAILGERHERGTWHSRRVARYGRSPWNTRACRRSPSRASASSWSTRTICSSGKSRSSARPTHFTRADISRYTAVYCV